jgi:hypothetical protein
MTNSQRIMATAAGFEAATGLVLLVSPSLLARLLIGSDIDGAAIIVANIAGLALLSLAIACWPRFEGTDRGTCVVLLIYNLTVALLLTEAGASSTASGFLLWPAVLIHVILTALLALTFSWQPRGTKQRS